MIQKILNLNIHKRPQKKNIHIYKMYSQQQLVSTPFGIMIPG